MSVDCIAVNYFHFHFETPIHFQMCQTCMYPHTIHLQRSPPIGGTAPIGGAITLSPAPLWTTFSETLYLSPIWSAEHFASWTEKVSRDRFCCIVKVLYTLKKTTTSQNDTNHTCSFLGYFVFPVGLFPKSLNYYLEKNDSKMVGLWNKCAKFGLDSLRSDITALIWAII